MQNENFVPKNPLTWLACTDAVNSIFIYTHPPKKKKHFIYLTVKLQITDSSIHVCIFQNPLAISADHITVVLINSHRSS